MDSASLSIAVAQPRTVPHDLAHNAAQHAAAIRAAGARVVVFPELSLTGYELDAAPVALDDPALAVVQDACRDADAVAFVGAVVSDAGDDSIATLRIDADAVAVAYRKMWLHGGEVDRFAAGEELGIVDVDGWRVGLAICRDSSVSRHTAALARAGVDLYLAGVLDVPAEREERAARSFLMARALGAPVAIASYADATSLYPETTGGSCILAADGTVLAAADTAPGSVATATVRRAAEPSA